MPIARVIKFQTEDGKEFDTHQEAIAHEHRCSCAETVKEHYEASFKANRADSLLLSILHDPVTFRNALSKLIRQNSIKDKVEEEAFA